MEQMIDRDASSVSIARRPVFDRSGRLWGYELFTVGDSASSGLPQESNIAGALASSAYLYLQRILQGGRKLLVDFTAEGIAAKLPYSLPAAASVIRIDERACQCSSELDALRRLKDDGYLVAVRDFTGAPALAPIYELADIAAVNVLGKDGDALQKLIEAARAHSAVALADGVHDRKLYEMCLNLGFSLLCGTFFKRLDTITTKKIASNETLRVALLKLIERDDPDMTRLAEAIQSDATLSFRLLAFLNSDAFDFPPRVSSIHQAVSLLGWSRIRNWLKVVLANDANEGGESDELVRVSAQRGKFLELVVRDHDFWGFDPESLHLLGVFSLLDALLGLPIREVIAHLPIDNRMKGALCGETNSEYLPFLRLAECFEEARWPEAEGMIQQLNLDRAKVMAAFRASLNWTGLDYLRSLATNPHE